VNTCAVPAPVPVQATQNAFPTAAGPWQLPSHGERPAPSARAGSNDCVVTPRCPEPEAARRRLKQQHISLPARHIQHIGAEPDVVCGTDGQLRLQVHVPGARGHRDRRGLAPPGVGGPDDEDLGSASSSVIPR